MGLLQNFRGIFNFYRMPVETPKLGVSTPTAYPQKKFPRKNLTFRKKLLILTTNHKHDENEIIRKIIPYRKK